MTACRYAAGARKPTVALCEHLVEAVQSGAGVSAVLRDHRNSRKTYYRWRSIARGEFMYWWDGCGIDENMQRGCRNLAIAVVSAELERKQAELDRVLAQAIQGSTAPKKIQPSW